MTISPKSLYWVSSGYKYKPIWNPGQLPEHVFQFSKLHKGSHFPHFVPLSTFLYFFASMKYDRLIYTFEWAWTYVYTPWYDHHNQALNISITSKTNPFLNFFSQVLPSSVKSSWSICFTSLKKSRTLQFSFLPKFSLHHLISQTDNMSTLLIGFVLFWSLSLFKPSSWCFQLLS